MNLQTSDIFHPHTRRLRFVILAVLAAAFLLSVPASAQGPLDVAGLDPDRYAIYIEDVVSGEILCDYNGDIPLTPASITKAVTSAAVTKLYSPESRFQTAVYLDGYVDGPTLDGDLTIRCYGDPTLASSNFSGVDICGEIAGALAAEGISGITGSVRVITDDRIAEGAPGGWQTEDLTKGYGAVYRPCNYADNRFSFHYPSLESTPEIGEPEIIRKSPKRGRLAISKSPYSNTFTVTGRTTSRGVSVSYPNSSPEISLALETEKRLKEADISVGHHSGSRNGKEAKRRLLVIHRSPTYGEILRSLMVRSDNLLAEAMLRTLAPRGSRKDALTVERQLFSSDPFDWSDVSIEDGSGLSRRNSFPAYFLADILIEMAQGESGLFYSKLFPLAGREGTVRSFLADTPLEGRMVLKSGSMSGVQCYAGYMLDHIGLPSHAVVIMVNGFAGNRGELRRALSDLLEEKLIRKSVFGFPE